MRPSEMLMLLTAALLFSTTACAQSSTPQDAKPPDAQAYALPDITANLFTGDLDGMIRRRRIRILVPYSKTLYFVDKGTQRGIVYDAFQVFEEDLNKKLPQKNSRVYVVMVPMDQDQLVRALLEGRGDIAAANLTITPERSRQVDFSDAVRANVSEIVVTGPGAEPINSVEDLSGKEVYLRKSSSYCDSVEKFNAELAKTGKPPLKIRVASEHLEMEDILEMVNAGLVPMTVCDDHVATFWRQIFTKITLHPEVALRTGGEIAWMIRKDSPLLKAELNAFLARYPEGCKERTQLLERYLKNTKYAREATSKQEMEKFERTIEFFRRYGDRYSLDYLLMMAQGYQESQLDQGARGPTGGIGVMQVLPATGKEMGVGDIMQLEPNIHAGVKYIRFMMDQYYDKEPMDDLNKGLFTFASYNTGPGHVAQLRALAAKRGLDPNLWFNNVELVVAEKVGRETVQYVSNIYKYYLAYKTITEERLERKKAKETAQSQSGR